MNLIDDLLNANIVEAQDAQLISGQLPRDFTNSILLVTLRSYFLKKAIPNNLKGSFSLTLYEKDSSDEKSGVSSATPNKLLSILAAHQIINNQVWQKLKDQPLPDTIGGYIAVLHFAQELTAYYHGFTIEKQLEFADLLHGEGNLLNGNSMFNNGEHNKLILDIKAGKLNNYLDFFNYSYCCKILGIPQKTSAMQVLKQLKQILNRLMFDSFCIKDLSIKEENFIGQPSYDDLQITLTLNTEVRVYTRRYTCLQRKHDNKLNKGLLIENILLLTNDVLADFAAQYRLTMVTSRLHPDLFPGQNNRYAVCRLFVQNMPAFEFYSMQLRSLFYRPIPVFRERLSYRRIEYLIHNFRVCGLLNHLSEQSIQQTIDEIQNNTYEDADELLSVFPGTTATVNTYNPTKQPPHSQLLSALGAMSQGVLNFTDIHDGTPLEDSIEDDLPYDVKFTCNGSQHVVECRHYNGQFDESVLFYLCEQILKKSYPELTLLAITSRDINSNAYIIINRKQRDKLKKANITLGLARFC